MNDRSPASSAMFHSALLRACLPCCLALALAGPAGVASAQAVNGTWTSLANGQWSDPANWQGGVIAGGAGSIADFSNVNITTTVTVQVNAADAVVGTILIGDTDTSNALQISAFSGYSLIFDNNGAGAQFVNVPTASNTAVSGPILLADSLTVDNQKEASARFLEFRGTISSQTAGLKTLTFTGTSEGRTTLRASDGVIADGAGQVAVVQASATSPLELYGVSTYTGGTTIQNGGLVKITADSGLGGAAGALTLNNGTLDYRPAAAASLARDVVLGDGGGTIVIGTSTVNMTGEISGSGGFTKSGSTTLTMSGENTYTGGTTVNQGNILISSDANLGHASGGVTLNGGNIQFAANLETTRDLVTTSTNSGGFSTNAAANNVIWSGDISGPGRINKSGSGTIHLQGNNTYEGGTFVTNGTLRIDHDGNLGAPTGGLSISNATLNVYDSTTSNRDVVLTGSATFAISFSSNTTTWNGDLSGTGGLTKRFSGDLVLNGTGSYTGGTTVEGGMLAINGDFTAATGAYAITGGRIVVGESGQVAAGSSFAVGAGTALAYNNNTHALGAPVVLAGDGLDNRAVLGGSGRIGSAVTLDNVGDTLAPGNSTGILTFTTSQSWSAFSYDWEISDFTGGAAGSDFDQIAIEGALALSGAGSYQLNLISLTGAGEPGLLGNFSETDRQWTIIATSGGVFGFDADLWTLSTTGLQTDPEIAGAFSLGVVGNDLVLSFTAIPEPSVYALALGLLAGAMAVSRRRRTNLRA